MSTPLSKDPDATLDYGFDWGPWLDGDTITESTWEVEDPTEPASATLGDDDFTASGVTTAWLSGGAVGTRVKLTNRIVTVGGRTDDRSISIQIREK